MKKILLLIMIIILCTSCAITNGLVEYINQAPIKLEGAKYVNTLTPSWTWKYSPAVNGYRIRLNNGNWIETNETSFKSDKELSEGSHTFELQTSYNGVWSESSFFTTIIDITEPLIHCGWSFQTSSPTVPLQITVSEAMSGVKSVDWSHNGVSRNASIIGTNLFDKTFNLKYFGEYEVIITVYDFAGNKASSSLNISYTQLSELYVRTAAGGDGSLANPYSTINEAIAACNPQPSKSYIIKVAAGNYNEKVIITNSNIQLDGGYNSDFSSRAPRLNITSINNLSAVDGSVFIPESTVSVIDKKISIRGFTITAPTAISYGTGIFIEDSDVDISECLILGGNGNVTSGIWISGESDGIIHNNVIDGGTASSKTNGIYISSNTSSIPLIAQNTIGCGRSNKSVNGIDNNSLFNVNLYNNFISFTIGYDYSSSQMNGIRGYCHALYNAVATENNDTILSPLSGWNIPAISLLDSAGLPNNSRIHSIIQKWGVDMRYYYPLFPPTDYFGNQRTSNNKASTGWSPGAVEYNTADEAQWDELSTTSHSLSYLKSGTDNSGVYITGVKDDDSISVYFKPNSANIFSEDNSINWNTEGIDSQYQYNLYNMKDGGTFLTYKPLDDNELIITHKDAGWVNMPIYCNEIIDQSYISFAVFGDKKALVVFEKISKVLACILFDNGRVVEIEAPFGDVLSFEGVTLCSDDNETVYFGGYDKINKKYRVAVFSGWKWSIIDSSILPIPDVADSLERITFSSDGYYVHYVVSKSNGTELYQYDPKEKNWEFLGKSNDFGKISIDYYNNVPFFTINKVNTPALIYYYNGFSIEPIMSFPSSSEEIGILNDQKMIYNYIKNSNGTIRIMGIKSEL